MTTKKSWQQKLREFGARESEKLTIPAWACNYGERLNLHELHIADAIAVRGLYAFFRGWLRPLTLGFVLASIVFAIAFISVRGMIITLQDSIYIPLSDNGSVADFPDLTQANSQENIRKFLESCLEGLYSLNSNSYQKTFKTYSNRCYSRSKQSLLARSVIDSKIFSFIGKVGAGAETKAKAKLVAFEMTSATDVGQILSEDGYLQYGYEVKGVFTKYDMETNIKQKAPAKFQVVVRNVVPFANPSGLTIISSRLIWDKHDDVESDQ